MKMCPPKLLSWLWPCYKFAIFYIIVLLDVRNRFPGKEKSKQNVEDILTSSSKRNGKIAGSKGLVAFFTEPQDPANLGIFRVFFGNYHAHCTLPHTYLAIYLVTHLPALPTHLPSLCTHPPT